MGHGADTRLKGKFHAVGSVCSHYGGPLAEGVLSGERVYCPWHQSVFNALSGDLEEPPGFDAVPRFEVRVEGDQVVVQVPDEKVERRTPDMCQCDSHADGRTFARLDAAERIADAIACSPLGKGQPRPPIAKQAVVIEDDVWIGPNAVILKGVRVGAGSWIEAGR